MKGEELAEEVRLYPCLHIKAYLGHKKRNRKKSLKKTSVLLKVTSQIIIF